MCSMNIPTVGYVLQLLKIDNMLTEKCKEVVKWLLDNTSPTMKFDNNLYFFESSYCESVQLNTIEDNYILISFIGYDHKYQHVNDTYVFPIKYLLSDDWKNGLLKAVEKGIEFAWEFDKRYYRKNKKLNLNEYQLAD